MLALRKVAIDDRTLDTLGLLGSAPAVENPLLLLF